MAAVTEKQWRQKFTLLTETAEGEPLLQALFAAAGDTQAQEAVIKGAKARLDEAAGLIDVAPEKEREGLRHELLGLIEEERGHARAYGATVETFVMALLRCLAAQHEKAKAQQTKLKADLKVYEDRVTALHQEGHKLRVLSGRAGSAVETQVEFLVADVQATARPIEAKAENTRRALDRLGGEVKGLAEQVAGYRAGGDTASIAKPTGWPRFAKARAAVLMAQNCLIT